MTGSSFDLPEPMVFTAGAVGEPGQRVFYLQAQGDGIVVTLRCEKQQVGALAEYLDGILADLPTPEPASVPTLLSLVEPLITEWVVGTLAVAWDEDADRVVLVAEELTDPDVDPDEPVDELEPAAAQARFRLTREQVAGFIAHARELVAGGRPPCRLCGRPLDPAGHACPRLN